MTTRRPRCVELLRDRGAGGRPVGFVGPLPWNQYAALADGRRLVDLNRAHTRLRLRKSDEELRRPAARGGAHRRRRARRWSTARWSGCTEHELTARIESAYVAHGGMHHIHYVGVTPMSAPDRSVPAQWPSSRPVAAGDLLTFELSAAVAPEYSGQLLRSVAVAAEPSPQVRELHDVAEAALDAVSARLRPGVHAQELVDAAGVIEDAGFTTVDDLVHGFGGGYLPPVIGSRSRAIRPDPRHDAGGRHDRRRPAERRHARRAARRADRRAAAGHRRRAPSGCTPSREDWCEPA